MTRKINAYNIITNEVSKIKELLYSNTSYDNVCSQIRMNLGILQPTARRAAIIFVKSIDNLNQSIRDSKRALLHLQKELNIDVKRFNAVKDDIRKERIERLNSVIQEKRLLRQQHMNRRITVITDE